MAAGMAFTDIGLVIGLLGSSANPMVTRNLAFNL